MASAAGSVMLSDGLQGVCAALGAPLVSCVGVLLWDKYWTGSAVRKTHSRYCESLKRSTIGSRPHAKPSLRFSAKVSSSISPRAVTKRVSTGDAECGQVHHSLCIFPFDDTVADGYVDHSFLQPKYSISKQ